MSDAFVIGLSLFAGWTARVLWDAWLLVRSEAQKELTGRRPWLCRTSGCDVAWVVTERRKLQRAEYDAEYGHMIAKSGKPPPIPPKPSSSELICTRCGQ